MLSLKKKVAFYAITATVLLWSGCSQIVETIPKVELTRIPTHSILLRNDSSGVLSVLPAADDEGKDPIRLSSGQTTTISFQLFKIADLEKTDRQWLRLIKGSETYLIESEGPIRYVDMLGNDGLIRISDAQGELREFLLNFSMCLEEKNPNFIDEIDVAEIPEEGIPIDMCE